MFSIYSVMSVWSKLLQMKFNVLVLHIGLSVKGLHYFLIEQIKPITLTHGKGNIL